MALAGHPVERGDALPPGDGPELDGPVQRAGDDPLVLVVHGQAGHGVAVATQHRGTVRRVKVPDLIILEINKKY